MNATTSWADGYLVLTNNINTCAMRGLGVPQVHFAIESQMDELALSLEMDPFELRRLNGYKLGSSTATRQLLDQSVGYMDCLDKAEKSARAASARKRERRRPAVRARNGGFLVFHWRRLALGFLRCAGSCYR